MRSARRLLSRLFSRESSPCSWPTSAEIAARCRRSSEVGPISVEPNPDIRGRISVARWMWVAFAVALALYIGVRVLILDTAFDAVCMPNYELGTIGNLSKVIVEGHGGAPSAAHFDNGGGHVVVGWMAVPLYMLFGESYLSLKLVPFTLGVLLLLLVARLLCLHYRPLAALLFAFLFALAAPTLTKYSLIAKGNHFENLFFQFLAISAFFELHTRSAKARWLVCTGLAGGIAVSFYFGALVTLCLLGLVHLIVRGPRGCVRDLVWAGPAFLVGLTPLLILDTESGGRGRNFLWVRLGENIGEQLSAIGPRLAHFLIVILPAAGCFEDAAGISGRAVGWVFLACFIGAWLCGVLDIWHGAGRARPENRSRLALEAQRFERWKSLPFLLHLPAMIVLVSAFDFPFKPYRPPVEVGQYRYLVPHFAFACVIIAIESAKRLESRARLARTVGLSLASASLLCGGFVLPIADMSPAYSGRATKYDGYWFPYYAHVLLRDQPWDRPEIARELSGFDPHYRHQSYFGVAFSMAWKSDLDRQNRGDPDALDLDELTASFSAEFAIDLARGAGSYLRLVQSQGPSGRDRLQRILEALARSSDPRASYAAEGLALDYQFPLASHTPDYLMSGVELREVCPPALRAGLERGLGIACGRLIPRGLLSDLTFVHKVEGSTPAEQRADFAFGMGWGEAESGAGKPPSVPFWHLIPPGRERAAMEGFGAGLRHTFGPTEGERVFSRLRSAFSGQNEVWVERGLAWENYPAPYLLNR